LKKTEDGRWENRDGLKKTEDGQIFALSCRRANTTDQNRAKASGSCVSLH
jgi:hypothetical protein